MADLIRAAFPAATAGPAGPLLSTRLGGEPLSTGEREALADLAGVERPVRAHAELLREGATADQLFVLVDGWACRYMTTRNGDRQIVAVLLPGDLVNPDAISLGRPNYGVRMLERGRVASTPGRQLRALADRHLGIAAALTRLALVEAAVLGRWALCLGRQGARQRVAHLICELEARLGGGAPRTSARFAWPLTQEHIADAVGLTTVHVNRMLRGLRADELVTVKSGMVTLPDLPRLRAEAEFDPAYLNLGMAAPERRPAQAAFATA